MSSSTNDLINRFIGLANEMKDEGHSVAAVSTGLMRACAVYATYSVAGNQGGLEDSGVAKITDIFQQSLQQVQAARRAEMQAAGGKIIES
jgi:hypothetical protein